MVSNVSIESIIHNATNHLVTFTDFKQADNHEFVFELFYVAMNNFLFGGSFFNLNHIPSAAQSITIRNSEFLHNQRATIRFNNEHQDI